MNEQYIESDQEYVFRVVNRKGEHLKIRASGSSSFAPQYTARTYQTSAAAAGVANRKNKELGYDEYRVQVSSVQWHEFDPMTLEIAS